MTRIVFGDADLRDRLLAVDDREEFCRLVSSVAADHGISLSSESVEASLVAARRRWLER